MWYFMYLNLKSHTHTHTPCTHTNHHAPTTHHKHGQIVAMFSDFHVFAVSGYLGDSTHNYFFVQVREGPHFHCFTTSLLNGTNHTSLLNGKLKHHQCTSQHVWANAQLHVYQPDHHDPALSMYFPLTTPLPVSHSPLNSFPATRMPCHPPILDQVSFAVKPTHPCFSHTQSRSVPTTLTSVSLTDIQAMTPSPQPIPTFNLWHDTLPLGAERPATSLGFPHYYQNYNFELAIYIALATYTGPSDSSNGAGYKANIA